MSTKRGLRQEEARLQELFAIGGHDAGQGRCAVCGYSGVFVSVHHVVAKAKLKRLFPIGAYLADREAGLWKPLFRGFHVDPEVARRSQAEIVWDPRNALLLCKDPAPDRCHDKHTNAVERVPRRALRSENFEFAAELGIGWILDAEYPDAGLRAA